MDAVIADEAPFRLRKLQQSTSVVLAFFDHPPSVALSDTEEQADDRYQINFVERGWFRFRFGRHDWTLGPGQIFLSKPGDVYRYGHIHDVEPDACLSLAYAQSLGEDVAAIFKRLPLVVPNTNRLNYLRLRLYEANALALDAIACELLDAAGSGDDSGRRLHRVRQLRCYASKIDEARDIIDADPAGHHSIWRLASTLAMSPFLFAHVFRELVGIAPHKYVLRKRLELARTLLEDGMSVTGSCHAAGYNNLGHFTRSFKRYFGVLPSAVRRT